MWKSRCGVVIVAFVLSSLSHANPVLFVGATVDEPLILKPEARVGTDV